MPQNQLSEKDMLQDSIMTEKEVSANYDTTIFESVNDNIAQTLQHIQQEEHNHGKLFFEAMHKRGWYNVEGAHINQGAKQQIDQQINSQYQGRLQQFQQQQQQQQQ